jgi:hypothetical protein
MKVGSSSRSRHLWEYACDPCTRGIRSVTRAYEGCIRYNHAGCQDIPECSITKSCREPHSGGDLDTLCGVNPSYPTPIVSMIAISSRGRASPSANVGPAIAVVSHSIGRICGSTERPGSTVRPICGMSCAPKASVGGTGAWPACWLPGGSVRSGAAADHRPPQQRLPLRRPRR